MTIHEYVHDRQDLINRFFGYTGKYRYLKKTKQVSTILENLEFLEKQIRSTDAKIYSKAHNIVYIYGGPRCGKHEYINLLEEALKGNLDGCVRLKLNGEGNLPEMIKAAFEGGLNFKFSCMNMVKFGEKEKLKHSVRQIMSGGNSWATGDKLGAVRTVVGELWSTYQRWENTRQVDKEIHEIFQNIMDELNSYKSKNIDFEIDVENPYLWIELDLMANLKRCKKATVVCVIEDFHFWDKYFQSATQRKKFLQFLNIMSDVIWVLVSERKPGNSILDYMHRENVWRMPGLAEGKTQEFLENECKKTTLTEGAKWREEAWRRTRGYVGLVDLCVQKENGEANGNSGFQQWCIEKKKATNKNDNHEDKEEKLLKSWFEYVWRGIKKEELEDNLKNKKVVYETIEFLMEEEFDDVRDLECEENRRYRIPCICYLVKKTLENPNTIGTARQFSWIKKANNQAMLVDLNSDGKKCLEYIQNTSPFCIEYAEFPDTVYLDPIIVEVISNHHKYNDWLKIFETECMNDCENEKNQGEKAKPVIEKQNIDNLEEKDDKSHEKVDEKLEIQENDLSSEKIIVFGQWKKNDKIKKGEKFVKNTTEHIERDNMPYDAVGEKSGEKTEQIEEVSKDEEVAKEATNKGENNNIENKTASEETSNADDKNVPDGNNDLNDKTKKNINNNK